MSLKAVAGPHAPAGSPQPGAGESPLPPGPNLLSVRGDAFHVTSISLMLLAGMGIVVMLQWAQAVFIPLVLGILINYALEPAVARLVKWRLPRALAAAIVLAGVTAAAGSLIYSLRGQATSIVHDLPQGARRLRQLIQNDRPAEPSAIDQVQRAATELGKAADAATPPPVPSGVQRVQVETAPFNVNDYLFSGSMSLATALAELVLIMFLAYFLLASGDLYRRKLVKIVGATLTEKKVTVQILAEIDRQIEMFLVVQLFTSTVVAVATWLTFTWLGVQQAALWGVLAGVFNSIPYFGPVLVTAATAAVAFLQFGSIHMALVVSAASLVITSLEGFLLTPWLTSRAARMNAVAIFVGLIFWGWVWNGWGLLLAVPMLMIIKAVCDHVEGFNAIGELLGE